MDESGISFKSNSQNGSSNIYYSVLCVAEMTKLVHCIVENLQSWLCHCCQGVLVECDMAASSHKPILSLF